VVLRFIKRYRWSLIGSLLIYLAVTIGLLLATDTPQRVPFEYQIF
jgi:hypothetical protein